MSEAAFRRHYSLIWTLVGAACMITGFFVSPRLHNPRHPWLTVVIGLCFYLFSLLLCRAVLMSLWRRPLATLPVLYFSVPIGVVGLSIILLMRWLGPNYLAIRPRSIGGLALGIGLLYAASLLWAVAIGLKRKKMGKIDIEIRP